MRSDSSGSYQFSNLVEGAYTVTPTKEALPPGTSAISTVDVIATQRHFLGITLLPTGCPQMAADTNADGIVTTIDVVAIQRFFLGLSTGVAHAGQYSFSPTNQIYQMLTVPEPDQDYTAFVFGDVASPFAEP